MRRATSAAWFGPESTATGFGKYSLSTSLIRKPLPRSIPFVQERKIVSGEGCRAASAPETSRAALDGATKTSSRASSKSSSEAVGVIVSGRRTPGRYSSFNRLERIRSTRPASCPHKATGVPLPPSITARAVPQLPAPMTPAFSMLFGFLCKAAFFSREQPRDIGPMPPYDKDRHHESKIERGNRPPQQKHRDGEHERGGYGSQRNVACRVKNQQPCREDDERLRRHEADEHARGRRDALPALEPQPDRETVARDATDGRQHPGKAGRWGNGVLRDENAQPHRRGAFEDIPRENQRPPFPAQDAKDIRRANISAAVPPDVHAARTRDEEARRDRPEQVTRQHYEKESHFRERLAARRPSTFPSGRQLMTSAFVSHPLRAAATPNQRCCKRAVSCASGLMTHFTPFSFASGHQRQSISSRRGFPFSSMIVPVSAAASMTAGMFTAYGSRVRSSRPVTCPRNVT